MPCCTERARRVSDGGPLRWQVVAYTILDIISKVVFSFMIVSAHDSLGSTSAAPVQSREYV